MTDESDGPVWPLKEDRGPDWPLKEASKVEYEWQTLSLDTLSVSPDRALRQDADRVEKAIIGAIRSGFDGVDINRPSLSAEFALDNYAADTIRSIKPWHYPAPDGANGFRTERYTWDWFSEGELATLLTAENPLAALERGHE